MQISPVVLISGVPGDREQRVLSQGQSGQSSELTTAEMANSQHPKAPETVNSVFELSAKSEIPFPKKTMPEEICLNMVLWLSNSSEGLTGLCWRHSSLREKRT